MFFPRNTRKTRKELDWAGEATMLRTSGPRHRRLESLILSAVSPGALRRPLRVRRLHRHGQDRPGSLAPARNAVTRKAVRNGGGGKHGFPDDGWTDGRADLASAGDRRDADLFRVFRVFRGKHHLTTFCCRKPRWQVNCIIPLFFRVSQSNPLAFICASTSRGLARLA